MNKKILIVSDIHINDYPSKNPVEKYRLYQARIVAQNIIEAGKKYGCSIIVFAGDILERVINRPYILAEVKLFLDTVMKEFEMGFIIWGNHDQDNKGNEQDNIDSSLWVMLPPNLYYADGKEITIGNSRIAFSNWYPKFDLSWIQGCVDLLITHATIDYSGGLEHFKSQNKELDQSKFSLAICGDIHKMAQIDKFVSIGVPQKCKMGDSDDASGVVYDCINKTWQWVNLNPHDNLMKHKYTSDINLEGWHQDENTWYQYKPSNIGISSNGVNEIQIPVWDDINNLINDIILQANLGPVHQSIINYLNNNVEYKEVDFNFTLRKLHCENWRSIDTHDFYFEWGDKILIQGKNGSGKSSLLSAIKYALIEYPGSLKDFIQFGCKSCLTELTFEYQGIVYKISRGFKSGKPVFGLEIDGNPQKYNNKNEFNEDMHLRFPFIDYMDVYFFNSDHSRLIGSPEMKGKPERLAEIISKFFKLDKIDAYNGMALGMKDELEKAMSEWEIKRKEAISRYSLVQSELSSIDIPQRNREDCEKDKADGLELQRKAREWENWKNTVGPLHTKIDLIENDILKLQGEIGKLRDKEIILREIQNIQEEIGKINLSISELKDSERIFQSEYRELQRISDEGKKLKEKIDNLGRNNFCPTCHKPLSSHEDLEIHKAELEEELGRLGAEYGNKHSQVEKLWENFNSSVPKIKSLESDRETLNKEILKRNIEIESGNRLLQEKGRKEKELEECKAQLNSLVQPEEVTLPQDFTEIMMFLDRCIETWKRYEDLERRKMMEEREIALCESELAKTSQGMDELLKYIKLTGPTGKIYEEIMKKLADQFTDNDVKYEVESYNFKKKDHLALKSYYNNNGNYVAYDSCSDGQKTVLDIHFLSKIVTGMGLLVMDEFLKHLDPGNHELCIGKIQEMNIGCILLSSHMESVGGFNNKTCNLSLNDSGLTNICIK